MSLRGNNGGYKLARDPKDYTAGEILRAAEGTLSPVQCLSCPVNTCQRQSICSTLDFWKGFNDAVNNYVDNVTLADLVEQYKAKFESDAVSTISESGKNGNVGAYMWMLPRMYPKRWQSTKRIEAEVDNTQKIEIVRFSETDKEE